MRLRADRQFAFDLGDRWREPRIFDRLSRWFWCGVLGELYGSAVETRIANDFDELAEWLDSDLDDESYDLNSGLPRSIADAFFQESRLDTLRSRLSAAYKGLNTLVLRGGAQDFFWKDTIQSLDKEEVAIDIHHIFPRKWCDERLVKPARYNAIVNKTPISYKANRMIGGNAPSKYLASLQSHKNVGLTDEKMDEILASHAIPAENLRADAFDAFYAARKHALIAIIERAMGKPVQMDQSSVEQVEMAEL